MVLALTLLTLCRVASTAGEQAPNFIFVLSESLDGRLLRPGSAAKIPNIRALMNEGVRFDAAYANSPVCAPSRSALHSGRDIHHIPHEHNGMLVTGAWNNYEGLDQNYTGFLHERLAAAGYSTELNGKRDWTVGGHTETCQLSSLTFNVPWPYNITADGGWNEEGTLCASPGPVSPGGGAGPAGSLYAGDWSVINKTAEFASTAAQPFYAFAGTSILHPPCVRFARSGWLLCWNDWLTRTGRGRYATNEYWYSIAGEQPLPTWPSLEQMHPCDLQASMKRGCTPGKNDRAAYAAFYSEVRISPGIRRQPLPPERAVPGRDRRDTVPGWGMPVAWPPGARQERRARVRRVYLAELEEFDAMVRKDVRQ